MAVMTRAIDYAHEGTVLEGMLAYDAATKAKRPLVIIAHAWAGRTHQEIGFAKEIARLGYAGFALDLYGKGVTGKTKDECKALMSPLVGAPATLRARLLHVVDVAKALPEVDASKVVVMGFCFGGLCALTLARAGADVKGVASFHGLFGNTQNAKDNAIKAKIIVYHGWDDPMVPPDQVVALGKELTDSKADWRLLALGGAMHAFMNPEANDPDFGTVYNKAAADRSWASFLEFLKECFA